MSPPLFYYNSDLSTSVIVIFQFLFFVLRESFRDDDETTNDLDRSIDDDDEASLVGAACLSGVSQCRALVRTPMFVRQPKAEIVISSDWVVADAVKLGLPLVIVEDCSDVAVSRESCGSYVCYSCMQAKVRGMDGRPDEIVVRKRGQQSKRYLHGILIHLLTTLGIRSN